MPLFCSYKSHGEAQTQQVLRMTEDLAKEKRRREEMESNAANLQEQLRSLSRNLEEERSSTKRIGGHRAMTSRHSFPVSFSSDAKPQSGGTSWLLGAEVEANCVALRASSVLPSIHSLDDVTGVTQDQ